MKWILLPILFILVVIAYCIIDFKMGKKSFHQNSLSRNYSRRKGDIHLITHGKDLFSLFLSDIKDARSSIHILFYIVKDDLFSKEFLQLLIQKAEEGVEVRLLLDWLGSHNTPKSLIKEIRNAGGHVAYSNRLKFPFPFFSLQQRNHRKISVIDGNIGYVGGYNVGKEYIDEDSVLSPWRDYHLRILGEGVCDLQDEFMVDWNRSSNNIIEKENKYFFSALPTGDMQHQFFPTQGLRLEHTICELLDSAKTSICIGTPYFIPSIIILEKLMEALKRGVKIRIIVPKKADHFLVKEASFTYFRTLIGHGAEVYQYLNGFYHAKVIIVDEEICQIGTANFDRRSIYLNLEINCYIYDKDFIQKMVAVMEKDISDSHRLTIEELEHTTFGTKLKELCAKVVADLL
ncbi:cardiolipin synthase [Bacillus sp. FJAT-49736]|uniref:cardiolipin synthase n=1 Tax=Bacillus sp. FJAT-49736 TaxID=2833582 RepID=UPI001BCA44DF|nr:cardiolipin synthase [Bacillus sp. FJAT-49736]MBS4175387.1 cardiolipin synthase [Bacillus sp. FJAT-49736]